MRFPKPVNSNHRYCRSKCRPFETKRHRSNTCALAASGCRPLLLQGFSPCGEPPLPAITRIAGELRQRRLAPLQRILRRIAQHCSFETRYTRPKQWRLVKAEGRAPRTACCPVSSAGIVETQSFAQQSNQRRVVLELSTDAISIPAERDSVAE